ncbi:hypothetical protein N0V93_010107 [Gnomoniopsis smithogilvyi]|uniref:DUF7704 domain-containing protein n=1 Tax=Gnomoniopsis smithogilvyi TaxID=1191159 RepID=A0A9W8YIA2_9PEZI|nr:hypothetical protein N0V93_010107 [Gnomoniopsis smithogilvyi]
MACSTLPTFPLIILGVVEPLLLLLAYVTYLADPFAFYATQSPLPQLDATTNFPPQAQVLSYMLANVYLLLAALAIICCFSPSATTAKWYLVALAFGDYGHIYASYRGLPAHVFWNIGQWNDVVWGNIGASVVLNVVRWLTVMGAFGTLGGNIATGVLEKKNV